MSQNLQNTSLHPPVPESNADFGDSSNDGEIDPASTTQIKSLKRQLAAMEQQLSSSNKRSRKIRTTMSLGRGIRRVATLYDSVSSVLDEADAQNSEDSEETFERSQQRMAAAWPIILSLVPSLKNLLANEEDVETIMSYLNELQHGANSARSDDVNRIKAEVCSRINSQFKPEVLLHKNNRLNRGIQHDVCGRLLCPVTFNWNDLEVRASIRGSKEGFTINTNYYLTCLYSKPPSNLKRIEEGFLQNSLLVQVYAAIFTSPSSADAIVDDLEPVQHHIVPQKSSKCTKSCVSALLGMEGQVTGRAIAYAAVMLVFNLTDASQWSHTHNNFSFVEFYNFIVDYFEVERSAAATKRVQNLLKWWKRKIFPQFISISKDITESHRILLEQDDDY